MKNDNFERSSGVESYLLPIYASFEKYGGGGNGAIALNDGGTAICTESSGIVYANRNMTALIWDMDTSSRSIYKCVVQSCNSGDQVGSHGVSSASRYSTIAVVDITTIVSKLNLPSAFSKWALHSQIYGGGGADYTTDSSVFATQYYFVKNLQEGNFVSIGVDKNGEFFDGRLTIGHYGIGCCLAGSQAQSCFHASALIE